MKTGGVFGSGRRGGARKGAGRPKGGHDGVKAALRSKLLELTEQNGRSARDELLWDFQFLGEMARDAVANENYDDATKYAVLASEAAARAAPYMHSRMPAAIDVTHKYDLSKLSQAQLASLEQIILAIADARTGESGEAETHH